MGGSDTDSDPKETQMRLYVGNLSTSTTEEDVRTAFAAKGTVKDVHFMAKRKSGRPRGFAFVDMGSEEEAQAAIASMNGTDLDGNTIKVSEAKERYRPSESSGSGYGGGGGRGGFGGGGGRGGKRR